MSVYTPTDESAHEQNAHEQFAVQVYYEDTDMAGIVYHANYLKYIERGRSHFVTACGVDQLSLRDEYGIVFAVTQLEARYLRPARFNDQLLVRTQIARSTALRFVFQQRIFKDSDIIFQADVTVASMTLAGAPARLPAELRRKLPIS